MTVVAYRIGTDTPAYTAEDMSGAGAQVTGGRWNSKGKPVVYTASSIALACLETVVHLNALSLPLNRYLVEISIPDDVWAQAVRFDSAAYIGWDAYPHGKVSLDAGDAWLSASASALLLVPPAIIPEESNVLINPLHPDAARISARKLRRFQYDTRLGPKP